MMLVTQLRCHRCHGQTVSGDDPDAGPTLTCLLCGSVRYVDSPNPEATFEDGLMENGHAPDRDDMSLDAWEQATERLLEQLAERRAQLGEQRAALQESIDELLASDRAVRAGLDAYRRSMAKAAGISQGRNPTSRAGAVAVDGRLNSWAGLSDVERTERSVRMIESRRRNREAQLEALVAVEPASDASAPLTSLA